MFLPMLKPVGRRKVVRQPLVKLFFDLSKLGVARTGLLRGRELSSLGSSLPLRSSDRPHSGSSLVPGLVIRTLFSRLSSSRLSVVSPGTLHVSTAPRTSLGRVGFRIRLRSALKFKGLLPRYRLPACASRLAIARLAASAHSARSRFSELLGSKPLTRSGLRLLKSSLRVKRSHLRRLKTNSRSIITETSREAAPASPLKGLLSSRGEIFRSARRDVAVEAVGRSRRYAGLVPRLLHWELRYSRPSIMLKEHLT